MSTSETATLLNRPVRMHEANNGLRFISRKLVANPLPSEPTIEPTIEQKWVVQSQWKAWFLSLRPDSAFLE